MPCYSPLRGWREPFPNKNGKFRISGIKARSANAPVPPGVCVVDLPCGQCIGCRLERSRKWAVRCMNEASLHDRNCFITLTYDDAHLPSFGGLDAKALQLFFKRLRKYAGPKVRFFACGEYGSQLGRPHYHAVLFNFDFADKKLWKSGGVGNLYTSAVLGRLWPFGFSTVGDVTFESAAYVARYVLKKVTGDLAKSHYTKLDPYTGELYEIEPEFVRMSRRPGIGRDWYSRYSGDVFPSDFMISRGVKMKPPRFYDGIYELTDPELMAVVRERRSVKAWAGRDDSTLDRLKVREQVAHAGLSLKRRSLDNED